MDETYPIILSGVKRGTLSVRRQGLFTEFAARCADPGGVLRLSVYGDGREGYLGVMEPCNGELTLLRRLSRTAMAGFPSPIAYAAAAGKKSAPPPEEPAQPPPDSGGAHTDLLWYQAGDGSLVTTWKGRQFRAIPMAGWGLPLEQAVERRTIDGVEYAVFALDRSREMGGEM